MGAFSGRTVHAKFPSSDSSRCKLAQSPKVDLSLSMENEGLLSIPSTEMSLKTIEVQLCYHLSIPGGFLNQFDVQRSRMKLSEDRTLQQQNAQAPQVPQTLSAP